MAQYLVHSRSDDGVNQLFETQGRSFREVADSLRVGHYTIYTITAAKSVQVKEVTSTEVVLGDGSWDTEEE